MTQRDDQATLGKIAVIGLDGSSSLGREEYVRERKDKIKNFLSKFFRIHELGDGDDIFAMGFVTSLLAFRLVNFLQEEFSITMEDEDLDFENFRTINNMDALLERKLTPAIEREHGNA